MAKITSPLEAKKDLKDLVESNSNDVADSMHYFIQQIVRKIDKNLEGIAREHAFPKIKGELTPGKLRIRGLKLIRQRQADGTFVYWIEQRGKRIGHKLSISFEPNPPLSIEKILN